MLAHWIIDESLSYVLQMVKTVPNPVPGDIRSSATGRMSIVISRTMIFSTFDLMATNRRLMHVPIDIVFSVWSHVDKKVLRRSDLFENDCEVQTRNISSSCYLSAEISNAESEGNDSQHACIIHRDIL